MSCSAGSVLFSFGRSLENLGKPLTGDRGLPAIIRAISADVVTGDSRRFSPGDLEMRLKIVTGDNRRFLT